MIAVNGFVADAQSGGKTVGVIFEFTGGGNDIPSLEET